MESCSMFTAFPLFYCRLPVLWPWQEFIRLFLRMLTMDIHGCLDGPDRNKVCREGKDETGTFLKRLLKF
jgi:hypothetical protein